MKPIPHVPLSFMLLTSAPLLLAPNAVGAEPPPAVAAAPSLTLAYELPHMLVIRGPHLPGKEIRINYLEAYCRAQSTEADWVEHTVIPHRVEVVSMSDDHRTLRLRDTLADGVTVVHVVTAGPDEVDFRLEAHNPGTKRSEADWAQPCVRLDQFTGFDPKGKDIDDYLPKCFVFLDGHLTRMPDIRPWATNARYTPGQVWCPKHVPRTDVNPRPLSPLVPSNGLIGAFSADDTTIFATAWEPYQELFQGVARCLHADFRLGGLQPGETKKIRGKIYVVPADAPKLAARYAADFPEHAPQATADTSPERIATQFAEWTQAGAFDKLVKFYHPDELAAYQQALLDASERLKPYGEPAPFAQAGLTLEQAQALPPEEFMVKILAAAAPNVQEKLKEYKITVTTNVTDQTDSAAKVTVRTQAHLTDAQKESLGPMAALAGIANERTYHMKREGDRWYVLFDENLKSFGMRIRAITSAFEKRATRDKGRASTTGLPAPYEVSGYLDAHGRTVIEPTFSSAKDFLDGRAAVEVGSKWGFIDATGRLVIEPRFADVEDFSDGLAAVKVGDDAWGLIDRDGRVVLKPQYEELGAFSEGLIAASKDGDWGFIDSAGTVVIPFQFADAEEFLEGKAQVTLTEEDEEEVLIDHSGKVVGKADFDERLAAAMRKGMAADQRREKEAVGGEGKPHSPVADPESIAITGYRNEAGQTIIEPRFADGKEFSEGLAAVRFINRWGFIDATGRTVIKPAFTDARSFHSKLAAVELDDERWGFIDPQGRFVIKAAYKDASDFSEGLAAVEKDGLWGYIDKSGAIKIPFRYSDAEDFADGQAVVTTEDDEEVVIDRTGSVVPSADEEETDDPEADK